MVDGSKGDGGGRIGAGGRGEEGLKWQGTRALQKDSIVL